MRFVGDSVADGVWGGDDVFDSKCVAEGVPTDPVPVRSDVPVGSERVVLTVIECSARSPHDTDAADGDVLLEAVSLSASVDEFSGPLLDHDCPPREIDFDAAAVCESDAEPLRAVPEAVLDSSSVSTEVLAVRDELSPSETDGDKERPSPNRSDAVPTVPVAECDHVWFPRLSDAEPVVLRAFGETLELLDAAAVSEALRSCRLSSDAVSVGERDTDDGPFVALSTADCDAESKSVADPFDRVDDSDDEGHDADDSSVAVAVLDAAAVAEPIDFDMDASRDAVLENSRDSDAALAEALAVSDSAATPPLRLW